LGYNRPISPFRRYLIAPAQRKVSSMTTSDEDNAPTRAELQRIAFGRAQTPAELDAAHAALRRLVDEDAAVAAAAHPAPEPAAVPETIVVEYDPVAEEPKPAPRRRTLIPLLVIVGLFAGAVVGIMVTRPELAATPGAASASDAPTPAPTPDATAALKLLLLAQTKADKDYPFLVSSGHGAIQPASVHRIMTATDGATLWIGRSDSGICLMWSRTDTTDSGIAGAVTCASPGEFDKNGLTLSDGQNRWSWDGLQFTTTLGD
jgi:hypothetical protein